MNQIAYRADLTRCLVAISSPAHDGRFDERFVLSLGETYGALLRYGVGSLLNLCSGEALVHRARNHLVDTFLKGPATHLLFIDSDMGWEPESVLRLLAADKDFAAAAGPRKSDDLSFACDLVQPFVRCPQTGFLKAHHVGGAFAMLSRRCLEAMVNGHPSTRYMDTQQKIWLHALFDTKVENERFFSEDYTFCHRWAQLGGDVWLDPSIRLHHAGRKVWSGALEQAFAPAPNVVPMAANKQFQFTPAPADAGDWLLTG